MSRPVNVYGRRYNLFILRFCALLVVLAGSLTATPQSWADNRITFFRIGAGPAGGTVFPAAGWIAAAISNPPGTRPCEKRGSCGIPGLIAVVQTTEGGLANIDGLRNQKLDAAIAYADMAHAALKGLSVFAPQGPFQDLRAVASLAPESLHILVRKDSNISSLADLKGKRIAVGPRYSTSQNLAFLILRLHGVEYGSFRWFLLNPEQAANALSEQKIDAVMFLSRQDSGVARQMISDGVGKLLSLDPKAVTRAIASNPYLHASLIPSKTYGDQPSVYTVEMQPVLLVSKAKDTAFIEDLSYALWKAMETDQDNLPLAPMVYRDGRVARLGVPLHPGVVNFRTRMIDQGHEDVFPDPNYEMTKDKPQ
jgi:TRAP transporter TAXI family solute receptor